MTPYVTIHAAPMLNIMAGISIDIDRYYKEKNISAPRLPAGDGRCTSELAIYLQDKIIEILKRDGKSTTPRIAKELESNRATIYKQSKFLEKIGVLKLVLVGRKYHWEVV